MLKRDALKMLVQDKPFLIIFTKADGTITTRNCKFTPELSSTPSTCEKAPHNVAVWDLKKQAVICVNVEKIIQINLK